MAALTKSDLRDYVLAAQRTVGQGYVLLDLTHNLTSRHFAEIQFHVDTDIEDVRHRIYAHTGSRPEFMELRLNGMVLEDGKTLGAYNPKDHDLIRVIDHDPDSVAANGGLDDVSQVKKYEMSEEEYNKRPNTYRAWKAEQLKKDPNWSPPWLKKAKEEKKKPSGPIETLEAVSARIKVGDRCECSPGSRRGEVKYVGYVGVNTTSSNTNDSEAKTEDGDSSAVELPQVWIGVAFDEPVGKNDGTAKGKRYFTCQKGYGAFLKPEGVKVGDYPVLDPFASDNEEEGDNNQPKDETAEDVMEEL